MAQVDTGNNPNDPNNPNNPQNPTNQPAQGQTNQPATSGGAGAVTATGAANVTGQAVGTNAPAQPFQNIASYLAANEPQSQTLAGQVAGQVTQPINQTNTDITNTANTFTGQVNTGYTPENSQLLSAVAENPAYVVAENPQNVSNFQANLNDTYTGPTSFTQAPGYSNLETEIANAQSLAADTSTPAGVQTLLQNVEGPTTPGINNLDTLLLYNNPANLETVQNAGTGAAALPGTLTNTTAAENALAAQGGTAASQTAADAAAALQSALTGEETNLTNEQNTVEGVVNQYNKDLGIINPVTSTIAADIQNFLQANPNLTLNTSNNMLAPLENLSPLAMPTEATYASPQDYAELAALASLGENPSNLSNLPISSATANEAQTFQLPTALENAVGQAPAVEQALTGELNTLGGEINTAVAPFESAQSQSGAGRNEFNAITGTNDIYEVVNPQTFPTLTDPATGQSVPAYITVTTGSGRNAQTTKEVNPAWTALQTQARTAMQTAEAGDQAQINAAPGLQWVNGASTGYNDLISQINSELGQLGNVGVPTLNYGPNTVIDPVTGAPIGNPLAKQASNAAALATDIGATAASTVPAAESIASGITAAGSPAALDTLGLSPVEAVGPAAVAAVGAADIGQNISNQINSGISPLQVAEDAWMLSNSVFDPLTLPPQVFNSIGKDINSVINDIGNFFGNLF